jgi:hypothetical protein
VTPLAITELWLGFLAREILDELPAVMVELDS